LDHSVHMLAHSVNPSTPLTCGHSGIKNGQQQQCTAKHSLQSKQAMAEPLFCLSSYHGNSDSYRL